MSDVTVSLVSLSSSSSRLGHIHMNILTSNGKVAPHQALAGKTVVVTGASAGLGRAIVQEFARSKVNMGLIARGEDGLQGARQDVEKHGGQAMVLPLDVSDAQAIERAAAEVEQKFGTIDIWVNNAMVSVFSPIKEMTAEEFKRVTEVTYLGYVYGTMAALKRMLARDRGTIVQVGSALAYRAIPLQSAYCASKHAIKGFTESLRCELLHDKSNVKVSIVQMPALNTTQFGWVKSRLPNQPQPVPPIFQPEVGARAVVFAALNAPRELEVGYPTVEAILGEKLIPGLLDKYLADTCYSGQQTKEPVNSGRQDNLWQPVAGDHGAHGAFDKRSWSVSPQLWLATNKKALVLSGAAIAICAALGLQKKNNCAQKHKSNHFTNNHNKGAQKA